MINKNHLKLTNITFFSCLQYLFIKYLKHSHGIYSKRTNVTISFRNVFGENVTMINDEIFLDH